MLRLELIIIIMIVVSVIIPLAYSYDPIGDYIWLIINPAQNSTLGGVYAFECPSGELAYAVAENGTFLCATP